MELFLDIYGNSLIRQKSQNYLDYMIRELIRLITQDKRCETAIKSIVDLSLLKYKERDELEDVLKSWYSKTPFDIEKYRDQRLRYHYKERYDYRLNLIDWDYNMDVSTFVSSEMKTAIVSADTFGALQEVQTAGTGVRGAHGHIQRSQQDALFVCKGEEEGLGGLVSGARILGRPDRFALLHLRFRDRYVA